MLSIPYINIILGTNNPIIVAIIVPKETDNKEIVSDSLNVLMDEVVFVKYKNIETPIINTRFIVVKTIAVFNIVVKKKLGRLFCSKFVFKPSITPTLFI